MKVPLTCPKCQRSRDVNWNHALAIRRGARSGFCRSCSSAIRDRSGLDERFWSKVNKTDHCWFWMGSKSGGGYGHIRSGKEPGGVSHLIKAHRYAYERLKGPIPEGLQIDHLCRRPACVNPDHLEPVTPLENTRRGFGNGRKTHCPQGHPYDENNTRITKGKRYCLTCSRLRGGRVRVQPTVLEMPSAHEEWLVLPSWNRLHRITELIPTDISDGLPNGAGRALCGASGAFCVPGFLSRIGLPRCSHCCNLLGIPRGDGNTFNAKIDEGFKVPIRRWEHYDQLMREWHTA